MQSQHKPVLIFAQSGRFLAQSATQAGFRVWVADCFGDQETRLSAERWQQLPPYSELSETEIISTLATLSRGENCILICGSGIESTYPVLDRLPANIELIGNQENTIHTLKTPKLFFELLRQHSLPFPETVFERPEETSHWLAKSEKGMGGNHIQYLNKSTLSPKQYFQRLINGSSGSALFLANGQQGQLLSLNKQQTFVTENTPFLLGKIETPYLVSLEHERTLKKAINIITSQSGLRGINSLDFMISEHGELLLLEVNPRPSASAELVENHAELLRHHISACKGLMPAFVTPNSEYKSSLHYIYAPAHITIPSTMIWPIECSDIPSAMTKLRKGEPICTSLIRIHKEQDAKNIHHLIEDKIFQQLTISA